MYRISIAKNAKSQKENSIGERERKNPLLGWEEGKRKDRDYGITAIFHPRASTGIVVAVAVAPLIALNQELVHEK